LCRWHVINNLLIDILGEQMSIERDCKKCYGHGEYKVAGEHLSPGLVIHIFECEECKGTGKCQSKENSKG
jgi:DnaJ-class molecular chaperone